MLLKCVSKCSSVSVSCFFFFFSSRRRHTRSLRDWSSDVCSSDLVDYAPLPAVVNVQDAAKEGAAKVWDDNQMGNLAFPLMMGNKDATDAAFAKADRKSTRLNSSHVETSYAVFCLKQKRS